MYVRWLDEIEDFRFDVTHLPGSRNPTDPLSRDSRRAFAGGDSPAASTGDPDAKSQQGLFSRRGRDASKAARLAVVRAGWVTTRQQRFSPTFRGGRGPTGSSSPSIDQGGEPNHPLGAVIGDLDDNSPSTAGPLRRPLPRTRVRQGLDDEGLIVEITVAAVFGPIMRGAAAALGALVDRFGGPVTDLALALKGGTFLVR